MSIHNRYMQHALGLARQGEGRTRPNPPVGAVVVRNGQIVGEGYHPKAGEPHAEIFALRDAGEAARGGDIYVTLEPCCHQGRTGPCAEAIIEAGISRVFIGATDPHHLVCGGGISRLEGAGLTVTTGVLEKDCRRLIAPFAKHITTGLPFVILKSAMTLDGQTATSTGDSQWISGPSSRAHVHRLRDRVDAIMVGAGTVLKDDPRLTTRLPEGGRDPDRIVLDSSLSMPETAALLHLESPSKTLIFTTRHADGAKSARLQKSGAEVVLVAEEAGRVCLQDVLRELGARGYQSLLLEGGARLNAAAFQARIVDRVMIFIAPRLLGGNDGPGIFCGPGVARLSDAMDLHDVRTSHFGDDLLIEGEVTPCLPG